MAAKYIIADCSVPFLCSADTPLWDFYNGLVKAKLVGVATSCGMCYYDPSLGWRVFSLKAEEAKILGAHCKYAEDAEVLNRHLFI